MTADPKIIIKNIFIVVVVLLIITYVYFVSKDIIEGPKIEIRTPQNGKSFNQPLINVEGVVKNVSYVSLNDRQIIIDEQGNFSEKILLFSGYNVLKLYAHDRFGREESETIELMLLEQ